MAFDLMPSEPKIPKRYLRLVIIESIELVLLFKYPPNIHTDCQLYKRERVCRFIIASDFLCAAVVLVITLDINNSLNNIF